MNPHPVPTAGREKVEQRAWCVPAAGHPASLQGSKRAGICGNPTSLGVLQRDDGEGGAPLSEKAISAPGPPPPSLEEGAPPKLPRTPAISQASGSQTFLGEVAKNLDSKNTLYVYECGESCKM